MKFKIIISLLGLIVSVQANATSTNNIPQNLDEAHEILMKQLPKETLDQIKNMKSEDEMWRFHRGLGMSLRNSWGLWGGSPLKQYFLELGITHPDNMSGVILGTFWCKIHDKPLRLEERVTYYKRLYESSAPPPTNSYPVTNLTVCGSYSYDTPEGKDLGYIRYYKEKGNSEYLWMYEVEKGWYKSTPETTPDWINDLPDR